MSDVTYAQLAQVLARGYDPTLLTCGDCDLVVAVDVYTDGWPPDNDEYLTPVGGTADGSMVIMAYDGEWRDNSGHVDLYPDGPSCYAVVTPVGEAWQCLDVGEPDEPVPERVMAAYHAATQRTPAGHAPLER